MFSLAYSKAGMAMATQDELLGWWAAWPRPWKAVARLVDGWIDRSSEAGRNCFDAERQRDERVMRPAVRKRLSVLIPALACVMCLGSAFAVSAKIERPALQAALDAPTVGGPAVGGPAEARATPADRTSRFRFASPATLVLGALGFLAMLKRAPG